MLLSVFSWLSVDYDDQRSEKCYDVVTVIWPYVCYGASIIKVWL